MLLLLCQMILALEVELIMKRLIYQRVKNFHLVRQAQFQPYITLSLVIQNQTVPHRIQAMTLTTVDFLICHGRMSKNSGSSQVGHNL